MILYSYKEEHQCTGKQKQKIKKAIDLKFLSRYEKRSHEIPVKGIYINRRFVKENRTEKLKKIKAGNLMQREAS